MTTYLQLGSSGSDILQVRKNISYTAIELDFIINTFIDGAYYLDARTGGLSSGYYNNHDGLGSGWTSLYVNGTLDSSRSKIFTTNQRLTLKVVTTTATTTGNYTGTSGFIPLFSQGTSGSHPMPVSIYSIKIYNGSNVVAYYDLSTGTVKDQSGNGNDATLTGGTFVDDGVSSSTTYIGSGTATGKSNLTSNETLILKSNNTSNGISSLTTSEQLISHQGTTYSGSGSSNGVSSLNTIESIINKSNGQSNGNASLNTTETKSYSANGNINSNSNVSQVGNVIYVDFANSQGQSSLTTTETFVQHGTTTYSAQGSSNGQSTLANNDKVTYKLTDAMNGKSTLTSDEYESLSAQGNVNGISSATSTEQFVGHATTYYSGTGLSDGTSNVTSSETESYATNGIVSGISDVESHDNIVYFPIGTANGKTTINTTDRYLSRLNVIGFLEFACIIDTKINVNGISDMNIITKGVI